MAKCTEGTDVCFSVEKPGFELHEVVRHSDSKTFGRHNETDHKYKDVIYEANLDYKTTETLTPNKDLLDKLNKESKECSEDNIEREKSPTKEKHLTENNTEKVSQRSASILENRKLGLNNPPHEGYYTGHKEEGLVKKSSDPHVDKTYSKSLTDVMLMKDNCNKNVENGSSLTNVKEVIEETQLNMESSSETYLEMNETEGAAVDNTVIKLEAINGNVSHTDASSTTATVFNVEKVQNSTNVKAAWKKLIIVCHSSLDYKSEEPHKTLSESEKIESKTKLEPRSCKMCSPESSTTADHVSHLKNTGELTCLTCRQSYANICCFSDHLKLVEVKTCKTCKQTFCNKADYRAHLKQHLVKQITCEGCDTTFLKWRHFSKHDCKITLMKKEEEVRKKEERLRKKKEIERKKAERLEKRKKKEIDKHTCQHCSRTYRNYSSFETHVANCLVCKVCHKTAYSCEHFLNHIHVGEHFSCKDCGALCKSKFELIKHKISYHDKPFKCNVCKIGVLSKSSLRRHIVFVHGGAEKYSRCKYCLRKFIQRKNWRKHERLRKCLKNTKNLKNWTKRYRSEIESKKHGLGAAVKLEDNSQISFIGDDKIHEKVEVDVNPTDSGPNKPPGWAKSDILADIIDCDENSHEEAADENLKTSNVDMKDGLFDKQQVDQQSDVDHRNQKFSLKGADDVYDIDDNSVQSVQTACKGTSLFLDGRDIQEERTNDVVSLNLTEFQQLSAVNSEKMNNLSQLYDEMSSGSRDEADAVKSSSFAVDKLVVSSKMFQKSRRGNAFGQKVKFGPRHLLKYHKQRTSDVDSPVERRITRLSLPAGNEPAEKEECAEQNVKSVHKSDSVIDKKSASCDTSSNSLLERRPVQKSVSLIDKKSVSCDTSSNSLSERRPVGSDTSSESSENDSDGSEGEKGYVEEIIIDDLDLENIDKCLQVMEKQCKDKREMEESLPFQSLQKEKSELTKKRLMLQNWTENEHDCVTVEQKRLCIEVQNKKCFVIDGVTENSPIYDNRTRNKKGREQKKDVEAKRSSSRYSLRSKHGESPSDNVKGGIIDIEEDSDESDESLSDSDSEGYEECTAEEIQAMLEDM